MLINIIKSRYHIVTSGKPTVYHGNIMGISWKYDGDIVGYHLVMTNSLPWKDPPCY